MELAQRLTASTFQDEAMAKRVTLEREQLLDAVTVRLFREYFEGVAKPSATNNTRIFFTLGLVLAAMSCGAPLSPDGGTPITQSADAGLIDPNELLDAGCPTMELSNGDCVPLSFGRMCELPSFTVLQAGVPSDDLAGTAMGFALTSTCVPTQRHQTLNSSDGGAIDSTGAPLFGRGETLVVAGGSFSQPYVSWLEASGRTPVFDSSVGLNASFSTRDGTPIFTEPLANFSASLDYFVLEFVRSQPAGPLSVVGYGVFGPGTAAAGWFFSQRILALPPAWLESWYVVRWRDLDGNAVPSARDEFSVLASGH